jgi:hypothetical protein
MRTIDLLTKVACENPAIILVRVKPDLLHCIFDCFELVMIILVASKTNYPSRVVSYDNFSGQQN